MNDVCMLMASSTPNQIRSMPSLSATGASRGTTMKDSSKKSRKNARKNTMTFTTIRKPSWPPGRPVSRCSTHSGPSTPWKVRPNMVAPTRMNTTKHDSLVVVVTAWRSSDIVRRPRMMAMMPAPNAPMAPPSVGVATPRKMVPSTRKISSSGGISTNVTRSAARDSRPMRVILLMLAATKASATPKHMDTTMVSSSATRSTASPDHQVCRAGMFLATYIDAATQMPVSTSSEVTPLLPLSSRSVRASGGMAGTHWGLKMASRIT